MLNEPLRQKLRVVTHHNPFLALRMEKRQSLNRFLMKNNRELCIKNFVDVVVQLLGKKVSITRYQAFVFLKIEYTYNPELMTSKN